MKKQNEAVFAAITSIKGSLTGNLTNSEISQVAEMVTQGIEDGEVAFSDAAHAKYDTTAKKFAYAKSMVKNWLRKSTTLNGGIKYVPETKRGPVGDATLKALKALLVQHPDNTEVLEAIEAQEAKIAADKAAKNTKKIDVDALPEHLRKFA
jgi:hypothetical protein